METSILNTIKKMLGLGADYTPFDQDIIVLINSAFMVLSQIGIGTLDGFRINGPDETWSDFLPNIRPFEAVKEYIYLKVKTIFDPPSNSFVQTSYENQIKELEWRLRLRAESGDYDVVQTG